MAKRSRVTVPESAISSCLLSLAVDVLTHCGTWLTAAEGCLLAASCRSLFSAIWRPRGSSGGRRLFQTLQFSAADAGRVRARLLDASKLVARKFDGQVTVRAWHVDECAAADALAVLQLCVSGNIIVPARIRFGPSQALASDLLQDNWQLLQFLFGVICFQDKFGNVQLAVDALARVPAGLRTADAQDFRLSPHRDAMRHRLMLPMPFLPHYCVALVRIHGQNPLALSVIKIMDRIPAANDGAALWFCLHRLPAASKSPTSDVPVVPVA